MKRAILFGLALMTFTGCTSTVGSRSTTVMVREDMNDLERNPVPGTVNDVWAEPMVDTVRIPGAIDPRGTYYRKAHTSVVEIRPGRYQMVEYPDDRTESDQVGN